MTAKVTDFDFDSLLLTVYGKGRKERRVPMSIDLRKILFRWGQVRERAEVTSPLLFPSRVRWALASAQRATELLLPDETFATQYRRNGGEVVRLSVILGHSDVSTTMKYLQLLTEDVQRPHQALSVLGRLRR